MKIKLHAVKPTRYPYFGIHKEDLQRDDPMIVLFTKLDGGILISKNVGQSLPIGSSQDWDEEQFITMEKEITISNW